MANKKTSKKKLPNKNVYNTSRKLFENKKLHFEQPISKQDIRPGMIITFDYHGVDVHDPNPLVLVLNHRYMRKMHAINLNYCNYNQILQLAKIVNDKITKKQLKQKKKYSLTSPYGFYHISIKPVLGSFKKTIYRTYSIVGIKNQKLIDYKFQATQGKDTITMTSKDKKNKITVTKEKVRKQPVKKKTKGDTVKQVMINKQKQKQLNNTKMVDLTGSGLASKGTVKDVKTVGSNTVKMVDTTASVYNKKG